MALSDAAVCERAAKLELEELKKILYDPASLSSLKGLLTDVLDILCPRPDDYEQRKLLIHVFNKMTTEVFGNTNGFPVVEAFGSFTMDLFTARSDLDLSINFSADDVIDFTRNKKIAAIRKFAKRLYAHQSQGHVFGVLPVVSARVPVLKVVDSGTGVECDISIENKDGITRSMVLTLVSSIDERFRKLCYLMKRWAKAHDINSSKDRTMSSMSIISLVAFHLQTRSPSILPPFSDLLKDGANFSSIENNVLKSKDVEHGNKESIAELFLSLIAKLSSVEGLWQHGLCASNYEGLWISKTWGSGIGNLSVEDFLDRSQNFARSVGTAEMRKINKCIQVSLQNVSDFRTGKIELSVLKALLFGNPDPNIPANISAAGRVEKKRRFTFNDSDAPRKKKKNRTKITKKAWRANHVTPNGFVNSGSQHLLTVPFQSGNGINLGSWQGDHHLQYIWQPAVPLGYPAYNGLQQPQIPVVPQHYLVPLPPQLEHGYGNQPLGGVLNVYQGSQQHGIVHNNVMVPVLAAPSLYGSQNQVLANVYQQHRGSQWPPRHVQNTMHPRMRR